MPRLTRWSARAALLYLLFGFALGGLLLSAKAGVFDLRAWLWLPAHVDALIVGWLIQLALAMAYWILPGRLVISRKRVVLAWLAFGLLNAGLLTTLGPALLRYWFPLWGGYENTFVFGLIMQVLALILFAVYAWLRIATYRKQSATPVIHSVAGH